ncbi:GyrI-like domain-containing protein [Roseateles cellulosilyticus]|uniref:GyrI-like domain-containing protein n=1 Tax=Pelomonas cellulosilytica TaxID=2906762 RepID=A0ABS8XXF9_9BURK|nr:GyrI-like domain-containing protein [Pelomonas sp. P8]MCE4555291.1 GyrI-like domain-containing protein [Pelomonas sp. P8]
MKPMIVTCTPLCVVGMQIETKPMSPQIPELWSRFVQREHEISGVLDPRVTYGVMQIEVGGSGALRYLAGLSVTDQTAFVPAGMSAVTIPAGQYAVFEFPLSDIGSSFDFIFNNWLPSSRYTQAGSPLFERYGADFDPTVPSSRMEAYIPVASSLNDAQLAGQAGHQRQAASHRTLG